MIWQITFPSSVINSTNSQIEKAVLQFGELISTISIVCYLALISKCSIQYAVYGFKLLTKSSSVTHF